MGALWEARLLIGTVVLLLKSPDFARHPLLECHCQELFLPGRIGYPGKAAISYLSGLQQAWKYLKDSSEDMLQVEIQGLRYVSEC